MSRPSAPEATTGFLPPFHEMAPAELPEQAQAVLARARKELQELVEEPQPPSWDTVMRPLDRILQVVEEETKPISHMVAVAETPELRAVYREVHPELSRFWSQVPKDPGLWGRVSRYAETEEARGLTGVHRRHLEKTLRWFRRSGADLEDAERDQLAELEVELAELQRTFAENVLDATAAYTLPVEDEERLAGLSPDAKERFRRRAEEEGRTGFLLTLDAPSFEAVMKEVEDRAIREELHQAYVGRCREGEHDNREIITRILALRREVAGLLGYPSFPDYRVEEWMVKEGARIRSFLEEMTERTRPYWQADLATLREEAEKEGLDRLRPWDVRFLMERIRKRKFDLDDEELRPYFPLDRVQEGLFEIAQRLFGLRIREEAVQEVWHPDVRHYVVEDEEARWIGSFYTDWFPRKEKRQGAWANPLRTGGPLPDESFRPHLAVIAGNFRPPEQDGDPALLTHREVQTLFHEFGHLLHHLTSQVPIAARSGLNVAWDWVEVPSQIMENWTWSREGLDLFARHVETGEPLPEELYERLIRSRRFMGGWRQMRQLGFGTVDLALHQEFDPEGDGDPLRFTEERLLPLSPDETFARSHILTVFTHLFAGGYASGYFSYLWSEVLEADLFTRFREEGILDPEVGRSFREEILSAGDSRDPEELFRAFLGRDPEPSALLERNLGPAPA